MVVVVLVVPVKLDRFARLVYALELVMGLAADARWAIFHQGVSSCFFYFLPWDLDSVVSGGEFGETDSVPFGA